jgi:hypothetical protein
MKLAALDCLTLCTPTSRRLPYEPLFVHLRELLALMVELEKKLRDFHYFKNVYIARIALSSRRLQKSSGIVVVMNIVEA